jgi:hypothetical protein
VDPDPDPGGPKTCGSGGSGSGSATLVLAILQASQKRKKNHQHLHRGSSQGSQQSQQRSNKRARSSQPSCSQQSQVRPVLRIRNDFFKAQDPTFKDLFRIWAARIRIRDDFPRRIRPDHDPQQCSGDQNDRFCSSVLWILMTKKLKKIPLEIRSNSSFF